MLVCLPMKTSLPALACAAASFLCGCNSQPEHPTADVVILQGDVRTMDLTNARATAVVLDKGRIAYVGNDTEAAKWIRPATRVLRVAGHTVLPGLIDSHIHVAEAALARGGCSLADKQLTIEQAAVKIRACAMN